MTVEDGAKITAVVDYNIVAGSSDGASYEVALALDETAVDSGGKHTCQYESGDASYIGFAGDFPLVAYVVYREDRGDPHQTTDTV